MPTSSTRISWALSLRRRTRPWLSHAIRVKIAFHLLIEDRSQLKLIMAKIKTIKMVTARRTCMKRSVLRCMTREKMRHNRWSKRCRITMTCKPMVAASKNSCKTLEWPCRRAGQVASKIIPASNTQTIIISTTLLKSMSVAASGKI